MNGESVADADDFVYEQPHGPKRKADELRSDSGFERIETMWTDCGWRATSREVVRTM
jgi:hypothetical protein